MTVFGICNECGDSLDIEERYPIHAGFIFCSHFCKDKYIKKMLDNINTAKFDPEFSLYKKETKMTTELVAMLQEKVEALNNAFQIVYREGLRVCVTVDGNYEDSEKVVQPPFITVEEVKDEKSSETPEGA